jgi:Cd2+/Zn2+-exporting ATPase
MSDHASDSEDGVTEDPATPPDAERETLSVPEMDCPSCADKVESALTALDGVRSVDTRPAGGTVVVEYDPGVVDHGGVVAAVEGAGYPVEDASVEDEDGGSVWRSARAKKTYAGGVVLALGLLFEFVLTAENAAVFGVAGREFLLSDLLFVAAVALGGQEILRGGYYSAKTRSLDIDFLMSAAIVSAVTASLVAPEARLYSEAATLSVLFSLAELLERYSMDRARDSLQELVDLAPDEATVRRDGEERTIPAAELAVGDVVLVRPGEKIPADGVVTEGESAVNQAPITGESVPVDKTPGEEVFAGTINEAGYLELEVTAPAGEDTLSRIVELVEDAESNRTEREQFVDRFAGYYTPVMVAVAIGVAAVPPLAFGADALTWFVHGITMLVLACPCAFVISTPVSVVSGVTSAARNGVLIKGGNHLEAMGSVDAVALDKTGTLTEGELAVTDVVPLNGNDEASVLRCARGLESRSEHPIAEAIVGAADGETDREVEDFESLTGRGVRATLDGTPHYAGKPALFDELGFDLNHAHVVDGTGGVGPDDVRSICERNDCVDLAADTIPRLQSEGKTVVLVGTDEELEGVVAVADGVRPAARWTVECLRERGVATVMLTGDNEGTARAIADQVGVDDYRAELLPEDKVEAIEELKAEYGSVAMVGDGINDGPALATATVGIAMGAAGTDTAIETADVALLGDDLSKLPYLHELSESANGVIRQNVWGSLAAKAVLAVGVPFGYVSVAVAVLLGDAGMTLGVTGNAMRLAGIEPEDPE